MQITITGPRGGGATTIAAELVHHFGNRLGQNVKLITAYRYEKQQIMGMVRNKLPQNAFSNRATITIVVSQETEDELAVKTRKPNT